MLINNLSDSNSIEIVNLKIPWRLWFYRCIFKKRVNVSRFITIKLRTPTLSLNSQGDNMSVCVVFPIVSPFYPCIIYNIHTRLLVKSPVDHPQYQQWSTIIHQHFIKSYIYKSHKKSHLNPLITYSIIFNHIQSYKIILNHHIFAGQVNLTCPPGKWTAFARSLTLSTFRSLLGRSPWMLRTAARRSGTPCSCGRRETKISVGDRGDFFGRYPPVN